MCPIGYGTCRPLRSVCALKHIQFCSQRPTTQRIPFRQGHTHSKRKKGSYYHPFRHNLAVANAAPIGVAAAAQAGPVQPKYPVISPVDAKALIAGKAKAVALDQIVGDVQVVKALPGDMNFVTDYCGNKRAFSTWLARELRDGNLWKKFRDQEGLVDTWGKQQRETCHLQKNDVLAVLNMVSPETWPILLWQEDQLKDIDLKPLLHLFCYELLLGMHTALPSLYRSPSKTCWIEVGQSDYCKQNETARYPWSHRDLTANPRTMQEILTFLEFNNWGLFHVGPVPHHAPSANFPEHRVTLMSSLTPGANGVADVKWIDLEVTPAQSPNVYQLHDLFCAEAYVQTDLGDLPLLQRFWQKYTRAIIDPILLPSAKNPNPGEPRDSYPGSIAHRFEPKAKPAAKTAAEKKAAKALQIMKKFGGKHGIAVVAADNMAKGKAPAPVIPAKDGVLPVKAAPAKEGLPPVKAAPPKAEIPVAKPAEGVKARSMVPGGKAGS